MILVVGAVVGRQREAKANNPLGAGRSDEPPRTGSPDVPLSPGTAARGRPTTETIPGGITRVPGMIGNNGRRKRYRVQYPKREIRNAVGGRNAIAAIRNISPGTQK